MLTRYPALDSVLNLRFEPVRTENPRAFTPAQIDEFNERGFLGTVPLFTGEALLRLQRFFHENDASMKKIREQAGKFTSMHHLLTGLYDIVTWPRTVNHLCDLLGPNVVCHTSEFVNKPPQQTQGGRHHQDATFNAVDAGCIIVWVAVDNADVENGCMWFIPGSHKLGVVECDANHYVVDPFRYGREIRCEVPAGHGMFMSDLLMHSSPPNRSQNRYRPGFTATYAPAERQPHEQLNRWAIQCAGDDPHGLWKPHTRPEGTNLFL
jgi:non-heme Fe2+,alpha-ketoglutarate-dependent halogenase